MSWGRRGGLIAVGLLLVLSVAVTLLFKARPISTKWPAGSDEERFARAFAAHDRERRLDTLSQVLQVVGIDIDDHETPPVGKVAQELLVRDGPKAIPILIGVIDADNSYDTVYNVGYHVLRGLTNVEYSPFHDGPWWRRWWDSHKQDFPADAQAIGIPEFDKSDNGRAYTSFPADTDTLQGKLRLAPEIVREWAAFPKTGKMPRAREQEYAMALASHQDPHAIPYLIGLGKVSRRGAQDFQNSLGELIMAGSEFEEVPLGSGKYLDRVMGRSYQELSGDVDWWLAWWQDHKNEYSADVAAIEIPDYQTPLSFDWQEAQAASHGNDPEVPR
ncbi:MAG TPA: hypothetical protein VGG64_16875 [Pirellulales bacterium]